MARTREIFLKLHLALLTLMTIASCKFNDNSIKGSISSEEQPTPPVSFPKVFSSVESSTSSNLGTVKYAPDGSKLVYCITNSAGIDSLYSINIDGSNRTKLSRGGSVACDKFKITLDSQKVVYYQGGSYYVNSLNGSNLIRLSSNWTDDFPIIHELKISPDSQKLAVKYRFLGLYTQIELYHLDGSIQYSLPNSTLDLYVEDAYFEFTPDSSKLAVAVGNKPPAIINADGSASYTILNADDLKTNCSDSCHPRITSNSLTLIYLSNWSEFMAINFDGTGKTQLSGFFINPTFNSNDFLILPDQSKFVYIGDDGTDGKNSYSLYSVNLDGTNETEILSGALVDGRDVLYSQNRDEPIALTATPDSSKIIYISDQGTDDIYELYAVSPTGAGGTIKLNQSMQADGDISHFHKLMVTPDSQWVVYIADQETDGLYELFSAKVDGSANHKLNGAMQPNATISSYKLSPDGTKVAFIADKDTDGVMELYQVNIDGTNLSKLSPTLDPDSDVNSFSYRPDSSQLLYSADVYAPNFDETFLIGVDGSNVQTVDFKLSATYNFKLASFTQEPEFVDDDRYFLQPYGLQLYMYDLKLGVKTLLNPGDTKFIAQKCKVDKDLKKVIFLGKLDGDLNTNLYSVNYDGTGLIKLNHALEGSGEVLSSIIVSTEKQKVFYATNEPSFDELYSVNYADGTGRVKLNTTLVTGGNVSSFTLSPDQEYILYKADAETDTVNEIYLVKPDGSGHRKVTLGGASAYAAFTPDSSKIIISSAQDNAYLELYVQDVDGSNWTKLNDTFQSFTGLIGYKVSPDSQKVVYVADQESDHVLELYSVNIDGTNKNKINPALVANGDVSNRVNGVTYELSYVYFTPDSQKVIYSADQETDEIHDIYSSNLDGSNNQKIWDPSSLGPFNYNDLFLASDSQSIISYNNLPNNASKLLTIPLDGSVPTDLISSLNTGDQVLYDIQETDNRYVFRSYIDSLQQIKLYAANKDGSNLVELSSVASGNGDVVKFQLINNNRAIFSQDTTGNGDYALFLASLSASFVTTQLSDLPAGTQLSDFYAGPDKVIVSTVKSITKQTTVRETIQYLLPF